MSKLSPIIGGQGETLCIRVPKVYDWVTRQVDAQVEVLSGEVTDLANMLPCNPDVTFTGNAEEDLALAQAIANGRAKCFFSDANGNPADPGNNDNWVAIGELGTGDREEVTVTLPDGTVVTLNRVKVLKKGFVTVVIQFIDPDGVAHTCCVTRPFHVIEKFFLCAPDGTRVVVHVTDFDCNADVVFLPAPRGSSNVGRLELDVHINMCQDVQIEADVKIEVTATFCTPREEIPFVCPPRSFPPQCPDVFPTI